MRGRRLPTRKHMSSWFQVAREQTVVRRAVRISLIVGTLLVLINHGDALIRGEFGLVRISKMLLTYLVPYCVSTYASVAAILELQTRSGA